MTVDFAKLSTAIDEALAPEVVEKKMTGDEFAAYAQEQITLAKSESEEDGRARLLALKEQVDVVAKFEFKPGELPSVRFYKASEQKRATTGAEQSFTHQQLGGPGMGWTAKAESLGQLLTQFLSSGDATPAKPGEVPPNTGAPEASKVVWPADLTLDN